ncbi:MAG: MotE family protein [Cognatishimia sp.]
MSQPIPTSKTPADTALSQAPKRRKSKRRRGSLTLISLFLIGSAVLRLGLGASQAIANVDFTAPAAITTMALPENCSPPADIAVVLQALQDRETRLENNEVALQDRMQALAVAEKLITSKLAELVDAEQRLQNSISQAKSASEDDIVILTAVYEKMKPQDAAALFEEMDPEFAAGFLSRMKPEIAAGILAGLAPNTAYTLSVVLAGRNANVPRE